MPTTHFSLENILIDMIGAIELFFPTQVIKDMFLLGRGELYLSFIDMADTLMKLSPNTTTQHG